MLLIGLLCLTGCGSTGPRVSLNLYNHSGETIKDVELLQNGKVKYRVASMPPESEIKNRPGGNKVPAKSTLRFTREDGTRVEQNLQPSDTLASSFSGNIFYQINQGDEVKAFYMTDQGKSTGSMPWNVPAAFENTVNIPGMGGQ